MDHTDLYDTARTVTLDGTQYEQEAAILESVDLCIEDHGILALNVQFKGEGRGWGQGTGYIALDKWNEDTKARVGTAEGITYIRRLLELFDANRLSDLEGRRVFIYRTGAGMGRILHAFHPRDKQTPPFFWRTIFTDSE